MARQTFKRRKFCRFTAEKIQEVDYKTAKSFLRASLAQKRITSANWLLR